MRILVGITGGIAAYKSATLIRLLTEAGHQVKVLPTQNALRFIGSATLEALSHNTVDPDLYSQVEDVKHIKLAQEADLVVVAPATAAFIARMANGLADDLLLNVIMATRAKILIAPAMHSEMWLNSATQANIATLRSRSVEILDPAVGRLTGSDSGVGRMVEPEEIFQAIIRSETANSDLAGKTVVVAAGGTHEPIDSVRFIGNRSSGKQGLAIAQAAKKRGAKVLLINCNMTCEIPSDIKSTEVETAQELLDTLSKTISSTDYLFMPAAVGDFYVVNAAEKKIKKETIAEPILQLRQNPDVIATLSEQIAQERLSTVLIGFAAEDTDNKDDLVNEARRKMDAKGMHFIVANDISMGKVFDSDTNSVEMLSKSSRASVSGTKLEVAEKLIDFVLAGS